MIRPFFIFNLFAFIITTSGCANPFRQIQRKIIVNRADRLQSFTGTLTETGTFKEKIVSEIKYQKPDMFYAKTISGGSFKGSIFAFAGKTLKVYYPVTKFGYQYSNVKPATRQEIITHMRKDFDWHMRIYDPSMGRTKRIAGYPGLQLRYRPRRSGNFVFTWYSWVYEKYSFPLKVSFKKGKQNFTATYSDLKFNPKLTKEDFSFKYPADATVAKYNLADKGISKAQLKEWANFPVALPAKTAFKVKQAKIIKVAGLVPGFTVYYESSPYVLYVSMVKDYGIPVVPLRGIKVKGKKHTYYLNFAGAFTSVYFKRAGTHYTVMANMPYTELLNMCETFKNI